MDNASIFGATSSTPSGKALPLTFDGCFGWLHPAGGRRGVVLCGPHGHEWTSCYRLWRGLACRLAAAGMPVIRFDYQGSGDSAGDDADPGRVAAWLASLRAAARVLVAETGVDELVFVGLRLGSLLAATVAAERDDVEALVLIAPVASGRLYARQLKAMSLVRHTFVGLRHAEAERRPEDIEVGGYLVTGETRRDLEKLEPLDLPRRPARRVLVLGGTASPMEERLLAHLRGTGAQVDSESLDYSVLIPPAPHLAQPADACYEAIAAWLGPVPAAPPSAGAPAAAAPPPAVAHGRLEVPGAVETAEFFGPADRLFGILCSPTLTTSGARQSPLVFVTSGANHHIGVNRLWVKLARRMALHGCPSLRIDIAGMGDSDGRRGLRDNEPYLPCSVDDVRAAIDRLELKGFRRVTLVGLCAGAYQAFHTAVQDPRVGQLLLLNMGTFFRPAALPGHSRPGHRSLEFYRKAALQRETWRRLLQGQFHLGLVLRNLAARAVGGCVGRLAEWLGRRTPKEQIHAWCRSLANRQVRTLFVSALEDEGLPALEAALGRRAAAVRHLGVGLEVLEGADHNLSQLWIVDRLERLLLDRLADGPVTATLSAQQQMEVGECPALPAPR